MTSQSIINLSKVLALAGKLDDSEGNNTPRERFRQFLKEDVTEVGQVRDYIEECLRNTGDQYNRALQDLVNYTGHFLGFDVVYGRYQGVPRQVGFDGLWTSPTGYHLVIEVKTSNVYTINIDTLIGYVDKLISSEKIIASWDVALGLYVVGKADEGIKQLDNAIIAEKRTHQLRVISVDALLSLAEMMKVYGLSHKDVLAVIRPSRPTLDWVVNLMTTLISERASESEPEVPESHTPHVEISPDHNHSAEGQLSRQAQQSELQSQPAISIATACWLTPVSSDDQDSAEQIVQRLVGEEGIYAFGENTPGRKKIKPGDWICFYATRKGVIAHAKVVTFPQKGVHSGVRNPEKYQWLFKLTDMKLYLDSPQIIDAAMRNQLEAFAGKDANGWWAWFVQSTHIVSSHDFAIHTGLQRGV